jgi:hypothetical protein
LFGEVTGGPAAATMGESLTELREVADGSRGAQLFAQVESVQGDAAGFLDVAGP